MNENQISRKIIGAAIEVHRQLGPGLLENTYKHCLFYELIEMDVEVKKEVSLPVIYKEKRLDIGYRLDLLVENEVIVELKTVDAFAPIHMAQLLTYLKLTDRKLGLLINFNTILLKDGVQRVLNGYL